MTETVTVKEGRARVFVAVDHCSGECVGNHAARSGNRFEALEPVRQGVLRHFGSVEKNAAKGLSLRHDHGSNYMSGDFQDEITFFGIESSPSFVRQPEGNGVAERFIRTLKENFLWVHTFDTIEGSRSHPPSDLVASDWAGFPRWGGELRACLTERTGFYDPYAAFAYPGVDRVRTSRPFGLAAAGA